VASKIGRLWAGKLYGTNTGNLAADFTNKEDGSGFEGTIRFMDDRFGPVVYSVAGKFDGTTVEIKGKATQQPENVETGEIQGQASLTPDGSLRGTWASTLGTGGTFLLLPHGYEERSASNITNLPEQLHTATRIVGAVRLYPGDVKDLIEAIRKDFTVGQVIANYHENGNERSKYAADFEREFGRLKELRYLRLHVQEPEAHGLSRVATIELTASGANTIRVQGIQESWVIGKAEALMLELRKYQKFFPTTFNKFGLNLNTLLAAAALIALPELSLGRRALFFLAVAAVIAINVQIHAKLIPNALIYLSAPQPGTLARALPQIGSTLLATISALATAIAYGLLKGEISLPLISRLFISQ